MAAAASKGAGATDSITVFLADVQLWTSIIGFVIQVWLTSKIHRYLGIGFALMILPVSLGTSAVIMLLNGALWAPGLARVLDQSLRYTVDKTTREILFLPLPADIKLKAKSFVDVTVDRGAKAAGALLLLVLVKPWGLHLTWQQLSYASLTVTGALDLHGALRPTRLPARVPPEHRAARPRARRDAPERRRPVHGRNAGPGAGAPRAGPRRLRDRRARVARQAQPGDAAAALSRVPGGARAGALCARRSPERSPRSGCRRSAGRCRTPTPASAPPRSARWRRSTRRTRCRWPGRCWPTRTRASARPRRSRSPAAASRPTSTLAESVLLELSPIPATPTARRGATWPSRSGTSPTRASGAC